MVSVALLLATGSAAAALQAPFCIGYPDAECRSVWRRVPEEQDAGRKYLGFVSLERGRGMV